jgi:hypothetical protein
MGRAADLQKAQVCATPPRPQGWHEGRLHHFGRRRRHKERCASRKILVENADDLIDAPPVTEWVADKKAMSAPPAIDSDAGCGE